MRSLVSIQLISPASGNLKGFKQSRLCSVTVSIQLISPASGNSGELTGDMPGMNEVSIQLISPASGNIKLSRRSPKYALKFPFN